MCFQYEDKTKYRIKKPMCATCSLFLHAFVGRNCVLHKDSHGRPLKRFEPSDVCNDYDQIGDGSLDDDSRSGALKQGLMDGSIEKK